MAHFAELDANNVVLRVIVVNNKELEINQEVVEDNGFVTVTTVESEAKGIEFCKTLYGVDTNWKQTSYSGNFRGKYAGIDDTFDGTNFVAPAPVEAPVVQEVALDAPIETLTTDQIVAMSTDAIVAISDVGTASITISSAGTADSITIETSNTGV